MNDSKDPILPHYDEAVRLFEELRRNAPRDIADMDLPTAIAVIERMKFAEECFRKVRQRAERRIRQLWRESPVVQEPASDKVSL
jgi:hypothetical protein